MRWKVMIWLAISSAVMISAQMLAIENDLKSQGVSTTAIPTTTSREHIVRQDDDPTFSNENGMGEWENPGITDRPNSNENMGDVNTNGTDSNDNSNATDDPSSSNNNSNGTHSNETTDSNDNPTNSNENDNENQSNEQVENNNTTTSGEANPASRSTENAEQDEVIVLTDHGEVKGHAYGTAGIISFFDIPYGTFAGPFSEPTKPKPWETVHDVKEHIKRCPQLEYPKSYVGDKDCLTLTVFTPPEAQNASVLFHVHDGNFVSGSSDPSIYGPDYLVTKGIILVLPNYRLGPLGFLCLQNETAPGNAALKDLTLALEWTKNNIQAFGGNPSSITVSGDGTSGALVGYLALSPQSRDYFTKAITESGSVLSHWAIDRDPIVTATNLAETIRLNATTALHRTNVFQDIDIETLVIAADSYIFKPCIEIGNKSFMYEKPWDLLHGDKVNIIFMMGSANHAGMHEAMYHTKESIAEFNENVEMFLPDDLEFDNDASTLATGMRIKKQYFGEQNLTSADLEKLSLYYTDASYLGPAIRGARPLVEAGTTIYFYEFSFVGELNRETNSMASVVNGAARGDIVGYVFTQDKEMSDPETPEGHMVDLMTDLWVSFIQNGKPAASNIEWHKLKKAEDSDEEWLSIEAIPLLRRGLHLDRLRLWTEIYKDHFVDRNLAFEITPNFLSIIFALTLLFGLRNPY